VIGTQTTKPDWIRLLQQAFAYGAGASSGKIVTLLTVPLYLHHLMPAEYGLIGIAIATTTGARILGVVGGSGALGICYFAASEPEARQQVVQSAYVLNVASALACLGVVLGILALAFDSAALPRSQTLAFLVLTALSVAVGITSEPLMLAFQLKQQAKYVSSVNFGASVVGGLVGWALLTLGYGVTSWAAAQLSTSLFTFYLSAIRSDVVLSKARFWAPESRALLKTWFPLLPGAALSAAVPVITPYVLWQTGGAQAAGIFAVASQFAGVVALLTGALATAWLPYFQSKVGHQIEWAPTYRRILHGHLIVGASVCLLVLLLAEDALRWLSADSYASAQRAIYPLVVANVLASVWSFLLPGTYYAGHTATVSWTLFIGALTTVLALALYGSNLDAAAASRALALGWVAVAVTQIIINKTRQYQVHRFGHGWVVVTIFCMCTSLFVR
jgi:O-antigen/teichoic acid export membrane protein